MICKLRNNNYQYKVLFEKNLIKPLSLVVYLFHKESQFHYQNARLVNRCSQNTTNYLPVDCSFSSISGGKFHRPHTLFAGTAMSKSPGRLCCLAKSSIININSSRVLFSLLLNLISSPIVEHVLPGKFITKHHFLKYSLQLYI